MMKFKLKTEFKPTGDQPQAIGELVGGLNGGLNRQTLLGVTGSGKTFTMANVIAKIQRPTLVIAHNKTLAAQLAQEYQSFFPDNAVCYFVSYYDYYQPEAYMPVSDTYIEKDAAINEEIDRLRHASTQALLTRSDVIIVASVSCIYGLGSPVDYLKEHLHLAVGQKITRQQLLQQLVGVYYDRTNADLLPGHFRATGNFVEIMPPSEREIIALNLKAGQIESIRKIDALTRVDKGVVADCFLFPAKHFITNEENRQRAIGAIKKELTQRLSVLEKEGRLLEAERLKRRTNYDLAMIKEVGYTNGIENYSRHLANRSAGEPPETLLSYFPKTETGQPDFLTIIDESHVTVPQLAGMYAGDASRKKTLIEHGFRLPSALDNRPLKLKEFEKTIGSAIFTSATPGNYEREVSQKTIEQVIRPTGLVDPVLTVKPVIAEAKYPGQIRDFIKEAKEEIKKGNRVMATTLTKKMAEDLAEFLKEQGLATEYLHSEIKTLDRIRILSQFRTGAAAGGFDCLIGVNLLREGLDLPEVTFIGILDADKEGFLRSETALIQTIGRAARNAAGRVALYADRVTGSLKKAIEETNRRRQIQLAYNKKHKLTPQTIKKKIADITDTIESFRQETARQLLQFDKLDSVADIKKTIKAKEKQMNQAVKNLDFETAAILRDELLELERILKEKSK
ncbi:MAG: excinuclease ABC subunit UvrB [Patescibacteria group bacterium]